MKQCWHLTLASNLRDPLFPDEALRRRAVRALARVAGSEIVLFCLVDDHVHVVVLCNRSRAGRLASALQQALSSIAPIIESAHIRPVEGRGHMTWLVRYIVSQPQRHGLSAHRRPGLGPAFSIWWARGCYPGWS